MWISRQLLPIIGIVFVTSGLIQGISAADAGLGRQEVNNRDVLAGCRDIPEVVALAELLDTRTARLSAYQDALDRRRADIATAEETLVAKLRQLRSINDRQGNGGQPIRSDVADDIDRLVSVYDTMKPRDAAAILGSLPPEFAAEILMRVDSEISAQILASIEPSEAAILTTHMGARHIRKKLRKR